MDNYFLTQKALTLDDLVCYSAYHALEAERLAQAGEENLSLWEVKRRKSGVQLLADYFLGGEWKEADELVRAIQRDPGADVIPTQYHLAIVSGDEQHRGLLGESPDLILR